MPIYEYQCSACEHELEALQKMGDDVLVFCPECHGDTLQKKISAAGFQLKGTGWYETDFKNSGSGPAGKAGKQAASKPAESAKPSEPKSSNKGSQAA